jgi:hypothetical protein
MRQEGAFMANGVLEGLQGCLRFTSLLHTQSYMYRHTNKHFDTCNMRSCPALVRHACFSGCGTRALEGM